MAFIDRIRVRTQSVDPATAEIWITVLADHTTPATELRGRLTGPWCRYASTVEVAYPLQPFPRPPVGLEGYSRRVLIPEPSVWEPQTPFLYRGPVELWDKVERGDSVTVTHGLRSVQLGPRGLRLNGKPLVVRGLARAPVGEEDALPLRAAGTNLLLASVAARELWGLADRLGFLMLGQVTEQALGNLVFPAAVHSHYEGLLGEHTSALGWVLPEAALTRGSDWWAAAVASLRTSLPNLVGMALSRPPARPLRREVDFVICAEQELNALADVHRPKLVLTGSPRNPEQEAALLARPGILGWVAP
jgi:hypothetical protein